MRMRGIWNRQQIVGLRFPIAKPRSIRDQIDRFRPEGETAVIRGFRKPRHSHQQGWRADYSGNDGAHTSKTFYDFMETERQRETQERGREISPLRQREGVEKPAVLAVAQSQAIAVPVPVPAQDPPPAQHDLASLMLQLDGFGGDKEAKKRLIQTLPDTQREQVMAALKTKKEDEFRRISQRDAELDGLL